MKITYLHQYFNTPEMSGGTRSYEMARRLVAMGHEVNMITSWREDDGRRGWFETEEAGIRVHWLPVPYSNNMKFLERLRSFFRFAIGAARHASRLESDVVFASSTPLTIAIPGSVVAIWNRSPMVFELRDLWPDVPIALGAVRSRLARFLAFRLERFAYTRASDIVVLAPTMRDFLSGKGVPLEKIWAIPNGSNMSRSISESSDNPADHRVSFERPTLLYCGSLGPAHGPEYLVRLAIALQELGASTQIVVVGEGKLKGQLISEAKAAGCLDESIRFVGGVPRGQVNDYFRASDASIMTMAQCEILYRHSVQNKFFDSLAAGRPVFANYRGWASEVAEREGVGEILPADNAVAAARKVHERMTDSCWLEDSGRLAKKLAEERFSFDLLAGKLERVLSEAATALR